MTQRSKLLTSLVAFGLALSAWLLAPLTVAQQSNPIYPGSIYRTAYLPNAYVMPDNSAVSIFTVSLPTNWSACSVHLSYAYTVTNNSTDAAAQIGQAAYAFSNNNGTVTGTAVVSSLVTDGTGCSDGACSGGSVTVAGIVATGKMTFNNSLSVNGALRYQVVNTSCLKFVPL
jgi:hypothetical protein